MDDFQALALSWDDLPSDTALPVTSRPTEAFLNERRNLRTEGDQVLIAQLIERLLLPSSQARLLSLLPIPVPEASLLGQWCAVFYKAINQHDFIAWAVAQGFDFGTLRVHDSALHVTARGTPKVFTLADTSDWWRLANPIIYISQLVDPTGRGMPYIGPQIPNRAPGLPLDLCLAFHGYPLPANRLQEQTIIEELRGLGGFPGFDDNGRSKSMVYSELHQQLLDYQQLANALDALVGAANTFSPLEIYRTRLHLTSGSRLARTLKEAAGLLQSILDDNDLSAPSNATALHYFDRQQQVLCLWPPAPGHETRTVVPAVPDTRWYRLGLLSEQLGVDVFSDQSLSIGSALQAYAIERPLNQAAIGSLVQHLREWPAPALPVVLNTARSFSELYRYRQYVGLLNDRHTLRSALSSVIDGGMLEGIDGLDRSITGDPDTLHATLNKAYAQLRVLTDDPDFLAIRATQRIAPTSHILFSASGGIGANGLDGKWKSLTDAVMDHPRLSLQALLLKEVAAKAGGYLRTNDTVTLDQALRLYAVKVPDTLDEARVTLQRLAVSQPLPAGQGHYWRALKPVSGAQPSAWTLSVLQCQQITTISERFMADREGTLFECLGHPLVAGKTVADVRAQADFLMIRLLASPLAQQLGDDLTGALRWHGGHARERTERGSRSALILAALILDLVSEPQAHPTRLNTLDWHADYYWGEPAEFVRDQIEGSLYRLSAPVRPLAAHLILSEKSPHLLVRDIPDGTPGLSSQAWVLYRQYVTYMEHVIPGSSRQLTYAQIMFLARLAPEGSWKTFLSSTEATWPILEWALVNGVLAPKPRHGTRAINLAIEALNDQRTRLASTLETFTQPIVSMRQTALADLRSVYPDNPRLEDRVFVEAGHVVTTATGPKYSLVDLHMADSLDPASHQWHSSDPAIDYQELAKQLPLLRRINQAYFQAFDQKLEQLKAAYGEAIRYWLSHLTLPRREALEYGLIQFFSLSRHAPDTSVADVGRFGVLVYAEFYSNRDFYEIFPRHLLIRCRRDLNYRQVVQALNIPGGQPWMRFDWLAYRQGTQPINESLTGAATDLVINKLDTELPAATELPPLDTQGRRVPRTLDSPRAHALTAVIVDQHLLHEGLALRETARLPITLAQAVSGADPWADYLHSVVLVAR
ncbi:hypothetical protein [Pseudomonas sp. KBW05]|uniref:hypothetical protein n=1 Tax=Pseudomonas sp. KBW05 TaxID=2153360 RepID=UPI000F5A0813|nr:hypothetical protein [Pseudomonas sp. KBW05]RQO46184.1 hypothetical protein DBR46_27465 [Pseudomonas sp. KBW05]